MKNKRIKKIRLITLVMLLFVLLLGIIGGIYVSDYYHADEQALLAASQSTSQVTVSKEGKNLVFMPDKPIAGFIFYPGGKVQYEAYAPLMQKCAEKGVLCILVHMPFNLAVLDVNAADGIDDQYPEIEKWYIGGHSLGGSMASSYVSKHKDVYDGLILLAAYSSGNIKDSGLEVLSVYGSEDKVLNMEAYEKNRTNLPSDFKEIIIDGGCHSYFGCYGMQDGDGMPDITNEEQLEQSSDIIVDFIKR